DPPDPAEPAEPPPEAGPGRLPGDGRGRRTRIVTERGELGDSLDLGGHPRCPQAAADGRTAIGSARRCSTTDQATFRRNASREGARSAAGEARLKAGSHTS